MQALLLGMKDTRLEDTDAAPRDETVRQIKHDMHASELDLLQQRSYSRM